MLNSHAHLSNKIFSPDLERRPTRDGFGAGVVAAGKENERVVVLCADLKESTRADQFEKAFPNRFVELGVAEQNMAGVASGMAAVGKIPFIASYACFNPGRNYEQIRTTIALNRANVKVCGMHAGVSVGPDGATHQMLEDIGMMRMLPGVTVLAPADALEAEKAVLHAARNDGPFYIRFGRSPVPVFTTPGTPFMLGRALPLWQSETPEILIAATGPQSYTALEAAQTLAHENLRVSVLHFPTIKPLDEAALLEAARGVKGVITVEEHQRAGGFGSAIAEVLSERHPLPIKRLGIRDEFGQSGTPEELLAHYGLDAVAVIEAARSLLAKS